MALCDGIVILLGLPKPTITGPRLQLINNSQSPVSSLTFISDTVRYEWAHVARLLNDWFCSPRGENTHD